MRCLILFIILFNYIVTGICQGSIIDSLTFVFQHSTSDEGKVLILYAIKYFYRLIHPCSALLITPQEIDLVNKIKFQNPSD